MNFSELEQLMSSRGVTSLAEIARTLNTTPQAVSNWKARNQVPHHVVAKLSQIPPVGNPQIDGNGSSIKNQKLNIDNPSAPPIYSSPSIFEEDTISLSDILLTMAEQLKVILVTAFISVFLTFTYVQFIQMPKYVSKAVLLIPEKKLVGGIAGIASQFGVNIPSVNQADLSSPSLFPDLIRSRTFAEKVFVKKFFTEKYGKELSLLAILTHGNNSPLFGKDTLITSALPTLANMLEFRKSSNSNFSIIQVTAFEPEFSKQLAEVVLEELDDLNRFFKSRATNEKTLFIENRIAAVAGELEDSERFLKDFNEKNRQVLSPFLKLSQERLTRNVEIQKGIFLTLKQELELAKIEEIQETSIVQVLDKPNLPLGPVNKKLKQSVLLAGLLGIILGILLGFVRSYIDNNDIDERKKLRRIKHFGKKKTKDILQDRRIYGIISLLLLIGLPFYLGHESKIPVFFGMYSVKLMLVNTVYVTILLCSIIIFIHLTRKLKK